MFERGGGQSELSVSRYFEKGFSLEPGLIHGLSAYAPLPGNEPLLGRHVSWKSGQMEVSGASPPNGDLVASGGNSRFDRRLDERSYRCPLGSCYSSDLIKGKTIMCGLPKL